MGLGYFREIAVKFCVLSVILISGFHAVLNSFGLKWIFCLHSSIGCLIELSFSFRLKFQLTSVLSQRLIQRNAISSRFLSTEASQETTTSKGYSSEQIQVIFFIILFSTIYCVKSWF